MEVTVNNIDYDKIYSYNNYGDFVFLEEIKPYRYITSNGHHQTERMARIKFLSTGTVTDVLVRDAMRGHIKDPYLPKIYGVACVGRTYTNGDHRILYRRWKAMVSRCYDPKNKKHKYYENCTVAPEWLCFENFVITAQQLPGYEDMIRDPNKYTLDKDILQQGVVNKVYSPQTCMWVPFLDNLNEAVKRVNKNSTSSKYYGIVIDNGKYKVQSTVRTPYGPVGMFTNEIAAVNMREYCRENYPQKGTSIPNDDYPNMSISQALSYRKHKKKVKQIYSLDKQMYSLVDVDDE